MRYLELAARLALGRRAYEDAARHLRTALSALELLAAGPERARYELELLLLLGQTLVVTDGWSTPGAEDVRARERGSPSSCETTSRSSPCCSAWRRCTRCAATSRRRARSPRSGFGSCRTRRRRASSSRTSCSPAACSTRGSSRVRWNRPSSASPVPRGRTATTTPSRARSATTPPSPATAGLRWRLVPGEAGSGAGASPRRDPTGGGARSSLALRPPRPAGAAAPVQARAGGGAGLGGRNHRALARERGYAYRVAQATVLRGWALAAIGRHDEGLELLEQGLVAARDGRPPRRSALPRHARRRPPAGGANSRRAGRGGRRARARRPSAFDVVPRRAPAPARRAAPRTR